MPPPEFTPAGVVLCAGEPDAFQVRDGEGEVVVEAQGLLSGEEVGAEAGDGVGEDADVSVSLFVGAREAVLVKVLQGGLQDFLAVVAEEHGGFVLGELFVELPVVFHDGAELIEEVAEVEDAVGLTGFQ